MLDMLRRDYDATKVRNEACGFKGVRARRAQAIAFLYEGLPVEDVSAKAGVMPGTLRRWAEAFTTGGFEALFEVASGGVYSLRKDYDAVKLRAAAEESLYPGQRARLLALASMYDGVSTKEITRMTGVSSGALREWREEFNQRGLGYSFEVPETHLQANFKAAHRYYPLSRLRSVRERARSLDTRYKIDVIILSYEGRTVEVIAQETGMSRARVAALIKAFNAGGIAALDGSGHEIARQKSQASPVYLPPGYDAASLQAAAMATSDREAKEKLFALATLYQTGSVQLAAQAHRVDKGAILSWKAKLASKGLSGFDEPQASKWKSVTDDEFQTALASADTDRHASYIKAVRDVMSGVAPKIAVRTHSISAASLTALLARVRKLGADGLKGREIEIPATSEQLRSVLHRAKPKIRPVIEAMAKMADGARLSEVTSDTVTVNRIASVNRMLVNGGPEALVAKVDLLPRSPQKPTKKSPKWPKPYRTSYGLPDRQHGNETIAIAGRSTSPRITLEQWDVRLSAPFLSTVKSLLTTYGNDMTAAIAAAARIGIGEKTIASWWTTYQNEGAAGLVPLAANETRFLNSHVTPEAIVELAQNVAGKKKQGTVEGLALLYGGASMKTAAAAAEMHPTDLWRDWKNFSKKGEAALLEPASAGPRTNEDCLSYIASILARGAGSHTTAVLNALRLHYLGMPLDSVAVKTGFDTKALTVWEGVFRGRGIMALKAELGVVESGDENSDTVDSEILDMLSDIFAGPTSAMLRAIKLVQKGMTAVEAGRKSGQPSRDVAETSQIVAKLHLLGPRGIGLPRRIANIVAAYHRADDVALGAQATKDVASYGRIPSVRNMMNALVAHRAGADIGDAAATYQVAGPALSKLARDFAESGFPSVVEYARGIRNLPVKAPSIDLWALAQQEGCPRDEAAYRKALAMLYDGYTLEDAAVRSGLETEALDILVDRLDYGTVSSIGRDRQYFLAGLVQHGKGRGRPRGRNNTPRQRTPRQRAEAVYRERQATKAAERMEMRRLEKAAEPIPDIVWGPELKEAVRKQAERLAMELGTPREATPGNPPLKLRADYDENRLTEMLRSAKKAATVRKFRTMKLAYGGLGIAEIADKEGLKPEIVGRWIADFNKGGLAGLLQSRTG